MPYVAWAGLEGKWAMALWTSTFWNSFVHVFMYSYYFMSAFGREMWWKVIRYFRNRLFTRI